MEEEKKNKMEQEGRRDGRGLIVRKMNEQRGTGDTLGQTLMDSLPVGSDSNKGSNLGLAVTGNSVITHTYICLIHCSALTQ